MTISVLSAARYLIAKSGGTLSNLKLQKLIYLSHMAYLAFYNRPLIAGHFEAWDYGPVHPELYHEAKMYGSSPVVAIAGKELSKSAVEEREVLDDIYEELGSFSGGRLVSMTHRKNGAWYAHYMPGVRNVIIPNEDILKEGKEIVSKT